MLCNLIMNIFQCAIPQINTTDIVHKLEFLHIHPDHLIGIAFCLADGFLSNHIKFSAVEALCHLVGICKLMQGMVIFLQLFLLPRQLGDIGIYEQDRH